MITKAYPTVTALAGVSVSIPQGQHVAIMGPSASGKSTLLNCMAGILTPNSGDVIFDGKVISALSDKQRTLLRRQSFGFVFQDGQLVPELPSRENVALPLLMEGKSRSQALNMADGWLVRLGLHEALHRRPGELSGGQVQRVAVARALIHQPDVIFADEPTGALDQTTGHELMSILTATARQTGATLLLVTHDITVAKWCERLIEIRDGLLHSDRMLAHDTDPGMARSEGQSR